MTQPQSPTTVFELAVNLDDVTPQVLGDVQERLLEAGALDVWTVPIGMKKQRPGVMLCALAAAPQRADLTRMIVDLTGTLGVRSRAWERLVLERAHVSVETRFGAVRLKLGTLEGALIVAQPEFEDVRGLSNETGVPLRIILQAAHAAADHYRVNLPSPGEA
ncbi:MAG: DUF111 family protein [Planctomycetota bacterium]|nr:DUF111 family protein [Planctomycetota bacterium]